MSNWIRIWNDQVTYSPGFYNEKLNLFENIVLGTNNMFNCYQLADVDAEVARSRKSMASILGERIADVKRKLETVEPLGQEATTLRRELQSLGALLDVAREVDQKAKRVPRRSPNEIRKEAEAECTRSFYLDAAAFNPMKGSNRWLRNFWGPLAPYDANGFWKVAATDGNRETISVPDLLMHVVNSVPEFAPLKDHLRVSQCRVRGKEATCLEMDAEILPHVGDFISTDYFDDGGSARNALMALLISLITMSPMAGDASGVLSDTLKDINQRLQEKRDSFKAILESLK